MSDEVDEMYAASRGSVANDWISVADRLPPIGQQVLAVVLGRVVTATRKEFAFWLHEIDTGTQTFSLSVGNPSHWMPLPAPPADGK